MQIQPFLEKSEKSSFIDLKTKFKKKHWILYNFFKKETVVKMWTPESEISSIAMATMRQSQSASSGKRISDKKYSY